MGAADTTPNRLRRDAVGGLSPQRRQLGLADNERLLNTVAGMATRARLDGLERIDHVIASTDGQRAFAVQGSTHDPAHRRSQVELEQVARTPARQNAMQLRAEEHTSELQSLMRTQYAVF